MKRSEPPLPHWQLHPGDGPPLLLVHGILSSRAQWLPNLAALGEVARPVVVELLGHSRSPSPDELAAYSPDAYVTQFERIRREVGVERWFVCGQSLGAALTLRYALDHPERVLASVFTNSASALADDAWVARTRTEVGEVADRIEAGGRQALEAHPLNPARSRRLASDVREALAADVALHDPAGVARTFRHTVPGSSLRSRIGSNSVPTLLVAGEREEVFAAPRRYAEATMPHLEAVGVDAGHPVNLHQPQAFDAAVTAFLRRWT